MKLVFFDIDGTLWDEKRYIPESTIEAIRALRKNGHKAFICSGRARANINEPKLFDIGFDGVLAACGNHIELDENIVYQNFLNREQLEKIIDVTFKYNMPIVLEGPVVHWISRKGFENDSYIDYLYERLGENARPLDAYEECMQINKFSAGIIKETNYGAIKESLLPFMDALEHNKAVVEFIPKGTSKGAGIKWLCEFLDVAIEDTFAIGDSINDVDMLKMAGHGIAMGNGTEPAFKAAEYITTSIYEDGIKNALKHYGLI